MDGKCLFMNQPYDCIVVLYNHVIVFTNIYCMVSRNCACNQPCCTQCDNQKGNAPYLTMLKEYNAITPINK